MESAERQSVRRALDSLKPYLESFLTQRQVGIESQLPGPKGSRPDIHALLRACLACWDTVLVRELPRTARSYIHELIDIRNAWAHEVPFSAEETARALDTVRLLGSLVGVPVTAAALASSAPVRTTSRKRSESQRDVMTRIYSNVGGDEERAIREYAAAEKRGEAVRRSNKHGIDAESYARALLNDGLKKGWLRSN